MMHLGNKIKELRKEKKWSQDELAEKINNNGRQISKYENNKITPSTEVVIKLAKIFDVSIDYLLLEDINRRPLRTKNDDITDKLELIGNLSNQDKQALLTFIDALVTKYKMQEVIKNT